MFINRGQQSPAVRLDPADRAGFLPIRMEKIIGIAQRIKEPAGFRGIFFRTEERPAVDIVDLERTQHVEDGFPTLRGIRFPGFHPGRFEKLETAEELRDHPVIFVHGPRRI